MVDSCKLFSFYGLCAYVIVLREETIEMAGFLLVIACVVDETKPRYSPSANQRPKACSAPRVFADGLYRGLVSSAAQAIQVMEDLESHGI